MAIHFLLLDLHALPESHKPFNLVRGWLWLWVEPCRALIPFAVHFEVVIAGCALPRTNRVSRTGLEIFLLDRVRGKILVAFHFHALLGFSENRAFPYCFCHSTSLDFFYGCRLRKIDCGRDSPRDRAPLQWPLYGRRAKARPGLFAAHGLLASTRAGGPLARTWLCSSSGFRDGSSATRGFVSRIGRVRRGSRRYSSSHGTLARCCLRARRLVAHRLWVDPDASWQSESHSRRQASWIVLPDPGRSHAGQDHGPG